MGRLQADEMSQLLDRRTALHWHLTSNHFPPIPSYMVSVAERAIDLVNAGLSQETVRMPERVTFKGRDHGTAGEIVDSMHLDSFIEVDEYYID